jgi:cell cycle sensor histidine kinase DivJ
MRFLSTASRNGKVHLDLASMGPDLYSLHRPNGHLLQSGENARRLLDRDVHAIAGAGFLDAINIQDRVAVLKAIADTASSGSVCSAQFRLLSQQPAQERWLEVSCQPVPRGAVPGEDSLVLAVTKDVTQHRRMAEELRLSEEKAQSANVAKSLFLANMSHELRTPLNAIIGFSELLLSDAMQRMPAGRQNEYVGLIRSSADHLLHVLTDILDMSKIDAGKYELLAEPFNIGKTLATCCAIMRGEAERKNIVIASAGFDILPEITADERAVKQIMINLLSNAIKFTPEGGRVSVDASRTGRNVKIVVTDNGIGISPEHIANLGIPFYQADSRYDRKYQGTGLGLSVVRGLVELHRGKLTIESRKGHGTAVTLTLPLQSGANPVPAQEDLERVRVLPAASGGGKDFSIAATAVAAAQKR